MNMMFNFNAKGVAELFGAVKGIISLFTAALMVLLLRKAGLGTVHVLLAKHLSALVCGHLRPSGGTSFSS